MPNHDVVDAFVQAARETEAGKYLARYVADECIPRIAIATRLGIDVLSVRLATYDRAFIESCVAEFLITRTEHPDL